MRFSLNQKIVGGYHFMEHTFYGTRHLGTDWRARYVNLYAPTDGKVLKAPWGTQGGQWLYFENNQGNIHRFGHLSKVYVKKGKVKEGRLIAKTGNTGKLTQAPHLHEDITKAGLNVNIYKLNRFIDPELFYKTNNLKKSMDKNEAKLLKWIKKEVLDFGKRLNSSERDKIIEILDLWKERDSECEFLVTSLEKERKQKQEIQEKVSLIRLENNNLKKLKEQNYQALGIIEKFQEAFKMLLTFKKK